MANPRLNIIVGPNAVGKTTLLEALAVATNLKSFRTSHSLELISFGESEGLISVEIEYPTHSKISVGFQEKRRSILVDEKKVSSKSKFPFLGSSVSFSPDDLILIKGSPEGRRNYLDDLSLCLDPQFERVLEKYERTLQQRNRLLKRIKEGLAGFEELPLWTETLIESAIPIYLRRQTLIQKLNSELNKIYQELFRTSERISIKYDHRFPRDFTDSEQDVENLMIDKLNALSDGERASGHSLVGPHKDDFEIFIDQMESRTFASQGQTRGLVIALKVAQIELSRAMRNFSPILLLDDIISELDDRRVHALVHYLSRYPGQMFVTTAEMNKVKNLHEDFSNFKVIDLRPKNEVVGPELNIPVTA